jgi:hypothetical protein
MKTIDYYEAKSHLASIKSQREKTEDEALELCKELLENSEEDVLEDFEITTNFADEPETFYILVYRNKKITGSFSNSPDLHYNVDDFDYQAHIDIITHIIKNK